MLVLACPGLSWLVLVVFEYYHQHQAHGDGMAWHGVGVGVGVGRGICIDNFGNGGGVGFGGFLGFGGPRAPPIWTGDFVPSVLKIYSYAYRKYQKSKNTR